jgi:putative transposase
MKKDYDKTGRFLTPAQYKKQEGLEFLKIGDALALANVQLNFEAAKSDYESGRRGRPKSKNKHRCKASYKTNAVYHGGVSNLNIDKNLLQLPKLDSKVKLRVHREIPSGGTLKNCTVTHEPNGAWMFSLSYEYRKKEAPVRAFEKETVRHIGLDMSVPKLYIDSMGNEADFYKTYRKVEKRIAIEKRRLSRMQYGSSNYEKQCKKIAKLYAKAKHQRRDMLHKLSCMLTDQYDLITVEDLDMAAMKKALKLGKSISDNGWGEFLVMLKYKSDRKGSLILQVDKWFPSSKTCLACGYVHKELTLKDRTYVCPACGHAMNRDHQAAVNIDQEGLRILHYYITEDQEVAAMNPTLLEKSTKAA